MGEEEEGKKGFVEGNKLNILDDEDAEARTLKKESRKWEEEKTLKEKLGEKREVEPAATAAAAKMEESVEKKDEEEEEKEEERRGKEGKGERGDEGDSSKMRNTILPPLGRGEVEFLEREISTASEIDSMTTRLDSTRKLDS